MAKKPLTQNQRDLIDLLGGYKELGTQQLDYFLLYIGRATLAEPFTGLDTAAYNGDGYYVVSLNRQGVLRILSTKLNGNTVNSLIQRKLLIPYKYRLSYQVSF